MRHPYRTKKSNQLSTDIVGEEVKLCGWVSRIRDHGGVIFIDLRDRYGIIQLVFTDNSPVIRLESVIIVEGLLVKRSPDTVNDKVKNGDIEVAVTEWKIESESEVLPFQINSEEDSSDELRLKYRFLDLRRDRMKKNVVLRSKFIQKLRNLMLEQDFTEFQTPILTASSPEGARDYLVPSRLHKGKFYALPQAPQQFKQLLMVSGFDKYFQIAPCFRDEDSRSDRSPAEFYQLDFEMSFVTQEEVIKVMEKVISRVCSDLFNIKAGTFPHITYRDAILKYGTDKPDLRNPLLIKDVTDVFIDSNFGLFKNNVAKGMAVRAVSVPNVGSNSRNFFDKQNDYARSIGLPGLGYINFTETGEAKGPIAKFLSDKEINRLCDGDRKNNAIFFISNYENEIKKFAGEIRKHLALEAGLIDENDFKFCWVMDFPLFKYDELAKKIDFSHNPFSMPQSSLEGGDPLQVLAYQYDLVGNGVELASGAIRNHKPENMYRAFEIAGYGKEEVEKSFPALLKAFKFGPPPHGGMALGIDRMLMLMTGEENIREVICFPMTQKAEDILIGAPGEATKPQLKELGIKTS
ncbi:MAG: aspartate--tRNA ligase [Rickettsiaceae bacterium H1]|nr:aspartate--tRNA ligase [Rickettsiaceae bacterium H1]